MVLYSTVFRSRLQRDSLVLKSIKRSVINIGRSMFDVQSKPGIETANLIKMDTLIYRSPNSKPLNPERS